MTAAATASSSKRSMPTVELFPFLAVLVCAMGALILVLMILTRQAHTQHAREAQAKMAQQRVAIIGTKQTVTAKVQQLKKSQETVAAQLAESRLKLGHVEDHFHQLQQQLAGLQKAWKDLDDFGKHDAQKRSAQEAELEHLKAEIAKVEKEVASARAAGPLRKRSFAIVPYEGPYGTHRRPIYVECCDDAIILQPEGIILPATDFLEPLGPNNTLATALRAIREYWSQHSAVTPAQTGEPYPLLLVRPAGVKAYYAAREAMSGWGSEFGYELVGEDWDLKYPLADRALAEMLTQQVTVARLRQQALRESLIAAAPQNSGASRRQKYRASPSGGIMREGGDDDDDEPRSNRRTSAGPSDNRGAEGSGSGGNGTGTGFANGGGSGFGSGPAASGGYGAPSGVAGGVPGGSPTTASNGMPAGTPGGTMAGGGVASGAPSASGGQRVFSAGYPTPNGGGPPGVPGNGYGGAPGGSGTGPGGSLGNGPAGGQANGYASVQANGYLGGQGNVYGGTPGTGPAGGQGIGYTVGQGIGYTVGQGNGYPGGQANGANGYPSGSPGNGPGGNFGSVYGGTPGTGPAGGQGTGYPVGQGNGATGNPGGAAGTGTPGNVSTAMGASPSGTPGSANPSGNGFANGSPGGPSGSAGNGSGDTAGGASRQANDGTYTRLDAMDARMREAPPASSTHSAAAGDGEVEPPRHFGQWEPTPPAPPKDERDDKPKEQRVSSNAPKLADKRGIDWALHDRTRGAVPLARPIRVECYPDHVVILPEPGLPGGRMIPLGPRTEGDVDGFVKAILEQMEPWGIAGRHMYWKPILHFQVMPGAEPRYADFQRLLDGSGLAVERK